MSYCRHILLLAFLGTTLSACDTAPPADTASDAATDSGAKTVTLLFTNDVESVYDPIPAHWLDDVEMIGGIAEMTTLIENIRRDHTERFSV